MANQLIKTVENSGIEKSVAEMLKERFLPFFEQAQEWKEKAEGLVVTDENQKKEMRDAREGRLALKEIRVSADKIRKSLKADSLAYGRAVQEVYNVIAETIAPIEKHLDLQERFAEIQRAQRYEKLSFDRKCEIANYMNFVSSVTIPTLGLLSEADYQKVLNDAIAKKQEHDDLVIAQGIERQRREAEEAAKRKIQAEEAKKLRIENQRLQAEYEEQRRANEAAMKIEREKAEAERRRVAAEQKAIQDALNAENERLKLIERQRIEKEQREAVIQAQIEKERLANERDAANAPDKDKLLALALLIDAIEMPTLNGPDSAKIGVGVKLLLGKVSTYIRDNTSKI